MKKDLRIKICSFFMAAVLSFFGTFGTFTYIAFADSPKTWADWSEVGEDAIKLRDSYFKYIRNVADGDFIGAVVTTATDIPISWLKTLVDGTLVISPLDDIYYWLKDGVLQYVDNRNSNLRKEAVNNTVQLCPKCKKTLKLCTCDSASGNAEDVYPVLPGSFLKDIYADYASRYMPMPNTEQYIVSWQNSNSEKYGTENKYFREAAPVYTNTRAWGNKGWSECYAMSFLVDPEQPGSPYFSNQYVHFYSSKDENNNVIIHYDTYNLDDNQLRTEKSKVWDISKYPVLGYRDGGNDFWLFEYSSYQNCFVNNGSGVESVVSGYLTSSVNRSKETYFALISYTWNTFHPTTQKTDDYGYILSSKPFELFLNQTSIDFDRIPDNYYITISGDTIYNYPISDPNGKTTTINNFITNNYIIGGDDSGSGGGDTTNNVWNIDFPDFITNITTSIETAITNVFVADIDVINNYNQEMQDTFNKKLPFLNDFGDIYKSLFVDIVDNNFVYAGDIKPTYNDSSGGGTAEAGGTGEAGGTIREEGAVIYPRWRFDINFFGKDMTLTILDFSMYAEPLHYVRIVVCAFIYILYFVNFMRYLPTLIGNVMDMTSSVSAVVNPAKKGGDIK